MSAYLNSVLDYVRKTHGDEPEFVQTVEEVFSSLLNNIYEIKKEENKNKLFIDGGNNIGLKNTQNLIKKNKSESGCCQGI